MCAKSWMKCSGNNLESNILMMRSMNGIYFFLYILYVWVCTMCMKNLIHSGEKQE